VVTGSDVPLRSCRRPGRPPWGHAVGAHPWGSPRSATSMGFPSASVAPSVRLGPSANVTLTELRPPRRAHRVAVGEPRRVTHRAAPCLWLLRPRCHISECHTGRTPDGRREVGRNPESGHKGRRRPLRARGRRVVLAVVAATHVHVPRASARVARRACGRRLLGHSGGRRHAGRLSSADRGRYGASDALSR